MCALFPAEGNRVSRFPLVLSLVVFSGTLVRGQDVPRHPENTPGMSFVDPEVALAADGLWRPSASGPAIDGAIGSYPGVTVDMEGHPRDATPDVGADEAAAGAGPFPPLTPADVGPLTFRPE